jgi:hypothetical protein
MYSGDHKIPLDPPLEKREEADDPIHLDGRWMRDEFEDKKVKGWEARKRGFIKLKAQRKCNRQLPTNIHGQSFRYDLVDWAE